MIQPFSDLGVDGGHPGPLHNKVYTDKLFSHIQNNFPNYIKI
jgi:hypothetical protein